MGIVVNHGDAADLTFVVKTPVCPFKTGEGRTDRVVFQPQVVREGNGRQSIGDIVDTGFAERDGKPETVRTAAEEGGLSGFIISDIRGIVIIPFSYAESDDGT